MYPESKALIISGNEEIAEILSSAADCFCRVSVSDGSGVRDIIEKGCFDLIILNTPLAEEFGLELASFIRRKTDAALIITASRKNCGEINKKTGDMNVCVLPRPLSKELVVQAIRFAMGSRQKILSLKKEKSELEKLIHDLKQIDRAKCVLIQYLRVSEADAHRMIQKRAMDERVPEIQIAMDILKTYEI